MEQRYLWYFSLILLGVFAAGAITGQTLGTSRAAAKKSAAQPRSSVLPEAIGWKPMVEGVEYAVLEGDPSRNERSFIARVRFRDGATADFGTNAGERRITVTRGTLAVYQDNDPKRSQEFPAGSFIVVPRGSAVSMAARGETEVQMQGPGPLQVANVRTNDRPAVARL